LLKIAEKFLAKHKLTKKTVSIALVGDSAIRRLNRCYLRQDRVTDVMAFKGEDDYLGEIVIGYRQVKRQARYYSGRTSAELAVVLVHGLFHLLGHEDKSPAGRVIMEELGDKFLKKVI